MTPTERSEPPAPGGLRIGHVHLRVSDLDRSVAFYRDVIGLDVVQYYGKGAAFLSAGGYHHHIGLNTWDSKGGTPPPAGHTGLYHTAFVYPTRGDLAQAVRRVAAAGIEFDGAADHGVSEALYLHDPDWNGVELYWDKPREDWPVNTQGKLQMVNAPLDLKGLLEN